MSCFAQIELFVRNKQPHEIQAGVRYTTLEGAVAEFKAKTDRLSLLETSAASCTCGAHERGSAFTPRNDRPFHTELSLKQAARVREADQASGFNTVLATVAAHKAAGLREAW